MNQSSASELAPVPGAQHLGDLARGGTNWQVYFETQLTTRPVKGRVHFVTEAGRRSTGWIFVEPTEVELLHRFQDFSAIEWWRLLESLA